MAIPFAAQFTKASGSQQVPAGGLTVTFTLIQVALTGGAMTTLVNGQAATEVTVNTPGEYFYVYSGALDFTTYFYLGAFKTTDASVAQTNIGAAYFDLAASISGVNAVETGVSLLQATRYMAAVLCGTLGDSETGTETFHSIGGSTPRVVFTVDSSGNRSAVALG